MKTNLSVMSYKAHNVPTFSEKSNKEWIEYGENDLYPYYLEDLFASSAMHGAIVKGTADMIYGEGLTSKLSDLHVDQWLQLNQLQGNGDSLKKLAHDLKLFGHGYLNIIWSQDRSAPVEMHHVPTSNIRIPVCDDEDAPTRFLHHPNWAEVNNSGIEIKEIPAFSTSDRESPSQILHVKMYSPLGFYYSLPDYIGATNYIELDRDISEFHLNNIKNGLFPSMMLTFNNGIPVEEERQMMERMIYDKFGGASNAGKILINWNEDKDDAPSVEPFNLNDPHRTYEYLSKQVMQEILSGHRVTSPLLFGLRSTGGGFGSNADEMRDAYDLYLNTVIQPFQECIIDALRPVLSAANITLPLHFAPLQPASFVDLDAMTAGDNESSYNGAQISSGVEVLVKVQEGILTEDQAKVFLVQMLQFDPEVADALFEQQASALEIVKGEGVQLKKKSSGRITEEQGDIWLRHLANKSAPVVDGYLWKVETVTDTEFDHNIFRSKYMFSDSIGVLESYDNHDLYSDWGDVVSSEGYHFALRYYYSQNDSTTESKSGVSRDFCQNMVALSKDGVMYRYEDIADMSADGINREFAAEGEDVYDIFQHKGGVNCYHSWKRAIYIYAPGDEIDTSGLEKVAQAEWDDAMRRVGNNFDVPQKVGENLRPIDGREN